MPLLRTVAAVLAVLVLSTPLAEARRPRAPGSGLAKVALGGRPPDFPFDAGGAPVRLSGFAGRPVVLNFWATWCAPCMQELPAFAELQKTYGADVVFIAVSDESGAAAERLLRANGVGGLFVSDPSRAIFGLYGITPIPVTIVLGRDGTVGHVSVGELDWPELHTAVSAAGGSPAS